MTNQPNNPNAPGEPVIWGLNEDKSSGIQIMGKAKRLKRLEEAFSKKFTHKGGHQQPPYC